MNTNSSRNVPVICVTAGDPAGIGPELTLRLLSDTSVQQMCIPVGIGNMQVFRRISEKLGLPLPEEQRKITSSEPVSIPNSPALIDPTTIAGKSVIPGTVSEAGGRAAYESFDWAVHAALTSKADAVVTAPLNKESLKKAGVRESGHTEILAHKCGSEQYGMLYWSEEISVSLATIHIALHNVSSLLSVERIYNISVLTCNTLRKTRGQEPIVGILGLNPHSGEHGLFGNEETEYIVPAIEKLQAEGFNVDGPIVPDTAFTPSSRHRYDGFVAMYHDQGSIPFKMLHFRDGVNHTMGLPIIRTSVDHGTAFDIAWQGRADTGSITSALKLAVLLAKKAGTAS